MAGYNQSMAVKNVYDQVIQDVIENCKPDFDAAGYSEDLPSILKENWEAKLYAVLTAQYEQMGAFQGGEWKQEEPGHGAAQYMHHQGGAHQPQQSALPADFGAPDMAGSTMAVKKETGYQYDNPEKTLGLMTPHTTFAPYAASGTKRNRDGYQQEGDIGGQNDGSSELPPQPSREEARRALARLWDSGSATVVQPQGHALPQLDGEEEEEGGAGNITADGRNLDDEELGSDDDDDDIEPETENRILTAFDKVDRVKSRYKCKFKHGVVHLDNRDFLFSECKAEFEF